MAKTKTSKQNKEKKLIEQMKVIIGDLERKVADKSGDIDYWKSKFQGLERKFEDIQSANRILEGEFNQRHRLMMDHTRHLIEIIRWKINPGTTNYPFDVPKMEKSDEEQKCGGRGNRHIDINPDFFR